VIEDPSYRSFVVRLWRASGRTEPSWHCEVEHIQSGNIVEVSSLEEAFSLIGNTANRDIEEQFSTYKEASDVSNCQ
jgi:hypothetical protein